MVFMTHPEHGANNVSESDVAEQEKNGWKVTSRGEWMGEKIDPAGEVPAPVRNKPGRKAKVQ